ncbi:MAG: sialidase family protein [Candidatus Dormiibacterota bacterium]
MISMTKRRLIALSAAGGFAVLTLGPITASSSITPGLDPGIGNVPQGFQLDKTYRQSYVTHSVTNTFVTSQQVSCYRPEVPVAANNGPNDGYTGELSCPGATTGEDTGAAALYANQIGSKPPYPAAESKLVTDHSESDIRVDPLNPLHLIGSSKWFTGAEGYNHLVGFYESWDGGKTWPTMGHVPGYEGFTDNTDPVGVFDSYGNYYQALLPYQFYYAKSGFKKYEVGNEPNPAIPNEAVAVAVRPHGATKPTDWVSTHHGHPDYVFTTDAGLGQEPDKEWIAIDRNERLPSGARNPNFDRIYMMYVNFNGNGSKPYVSTAIANRDGSHSDWTAPVLLPTANATNNNTYLFPHIDPSGVVYTSLINYVGAQGGCCVDVLMDYSTDGGVTWVGPSLAAGNVHVAPLTGPGYANTTFEDGIEETFAVGNHPSSQGYYPIYVAYESKSSGFGNILLTVSNDQGRSWSFPIQVNDNRNPNVDEFQPNLAVAQDGTVSVNFYDRRLACPAAGSPEAAAAGLALDMANPNYSGALPPYGAANYCIHSSVQFYNASLTPKGNNIRLTQHNWDPQLNSPNRSCSCNPLDTFLGDYFGNDFAGSLDYSTFISTYDDGTNHHHYQQQVVATVQIP